MVNEFAVFCQQEIAPLAAQMDCNPEVLRLGLKKLADRKLLALKIPPDNHQNSFFPQFQETLSRYSGALAFLQTQHQSAAALIFHSNNDALKAEYLPYLSTGKKTVGIAFSHLRRPGNPLVKAIPVEGGYQLEGFVPWITGCGFFQSFILGASLPDGRALYGLLPFQNVPGLKLSEPLPLLAMGAANTVTAELTNYFLPEDQILGIKPGNAIHQNDRINLLNHSFFALGCAQAGLDILEEMSQKKSHEFIVSAAASLQAELTDCRRQIYAATPETPALEKLQLRSWAIELAGRCAQAAVTVSSGAANTMNHPAGRVYREALVFTVSGQTTAVMEATLQRWVKGS